MSRSVSTALPLLSPTFITRRCGSTACLHTPSNFAPRQGQLKASNAHRNVITLAGWHLPWYAALALCCQRASHPDEVARVLGQQLSSITVGLQLRHVSAVSVHVCVCVSCVVCE